MSNVIIGFSKFLSLLEKATERDDLAGYVVPNLKEEVTEIYVIFPDGLRMMIAFKNEDLIEMSDEEIVIYMSMRYGSRLSCYIDNPLTIH